MFLPVIFTKAIIFRWNLKHFWSMIMIKKRTAQNSYCTWIFALSLNHNNALDILSHKVCKYSRIHILSQRYSQYFCIQCFDYWSRPSWKEENLFWLTSQSILYHIWMLVHALLTFLFLPLPQNDTIPLGVCHHIGSRVFCYYSF